MKHATIAALALFVGLGLAACAPQVGAPLAPGSVVSLSPPSENVVVAKGLAAAEQSLTLAMQTAKVYTDLPRCRVPRVERLCSDTAAVLEIRRGAIKAHNALMDARQNAAMIDTALQAVDLFRSVIPQT